MQLMEFLPLQNLFSTFQLYRDFIFVHFFFLWGKKPQPHLRGENRDKKAHEEIVFLSNVLFSMTA